jgi:hypothetical protein
MACNKVCKTLQFTDGEMQLKMQLMNRVETNEKEIAKVWLILNSFLHIYRLNGLSFICVLFPVFRAGMEEGLSP